MEQKHSWLFCESLPIRLERVATRPQRLFLCCRGLCVRRDGRRLIAPMCLRPT